MPSNIVKAISRKCGKTVQEVEGMWNEIEAELLKSGAKKSDKDFYYKTVGRLKFRLSKECLADLGWKKGKSKPESSESYRTEAQRLLPFLQRVLR